jgi:hypothetical protein
MCFPLKGVLVIWNLNFFFKWMEAIFFSFIQLLSLSKKLDFFPLSPFRTSLTPPYPSSFSSISSCNQHRNCKHGILRPLWLAYKHKNFPFLLHLNRNLPSISLLRSFPKSSFWEFDSNFGLGVYSWWVMKMVRSKTQEDRS